MEHDSFDITCKNNIYVFLSKDAIHGQNQKGEKKSLVAAP